MTEQWKEGDRVFARLRIEEWNRENTVLARITRVAGELVWLWVATLPPAGTFESPEPPRWIVGKWPEPVLTTVLGIRDGDMIPGLDDLEV